MTKGAVFTINMENVQADLDVLLEVLRCMQRSSKIHEAASIEEWKMISSKFDKLITEGVDRRSNDVDRQGQESPEPLMRKRCRSMEMRPSVKDLLEHRERLHAKELATNRETINSLIDDNIKIAESFKTCITTLCTERDHQVQRLKEMIKTLQEPKASTISASINVLTFNEAMSRAWKEWAEDPTTDKDNPIIQFEFSADQGPRSDDEGDDDYAFEFLESEGVDRPEGLVDRHSVDWFSSDDEAELEKVKYLRVWRSEPVTPAMPREVMTKVPVLEDLQEGEEMLQPAKIIQRDNTMEAIFMNCMVAGANQPLGLCLIDTGAALNVTSMETIDRLGLTYIKGEFGQVELMGGKNMAMQGKAEEVPLKIGGAIVKADFFIVDTATDRVGKTILGAGFLRATGAVIDYDARRISFNKIDPTKFYSWVDISSDFN